MEVSERNRNYIEAGEDPAGNFLLSASLWIPHRREEIFPFFADAFNLEKLTPPKMNLRVLTPRPIEMRCGLLIAYKLRVHGLPIRWQSEITEWNPPLKFTDEQRRGPYRRWIHQHLFEEASDGTLVKDEIRYSILGGRLVNRFLVRPDIEKMFRFRQVRLRETFPLK